MTSSRAFLVTAGLVLCAVAGVIALLTSRHYGFAVLGSALAAFINAAVRWRSEHADRVGR